VGTSNGLGVWGLTNYLYMQISPVAPMLNWKNGTLLQANDLTGPWVTNPVVSPYTVVPTNTQMFYRLILSTGP
jgi:hypothetical protein